VFVAPGIVQQSAGRKAENAHQFELRETAAGFLGPWLGISPLILRSVRQASGGPIDNFDTKAVPELAGFFSLGRRGAAQAGQNIPRQARPSLTVGAGAFIDVTVLVQCKEGLNLADHFAAGTIGVEHLIEEPKESASEAKDSLATVGPLVGLGQQGGRQEALEEQIQVAEALLA
jgi:hypothetical protein